MRTIHVVYHHEEGSWWAESDDMPGWTAIGGSLREIRRLVREGIGIFFEGVEIDLRESYADDPAALVADVHWITPAGTWADTASSSHTLTWRAS